MSKILFYGLEGYGQIYADHCLYAGVDITDPNRKYWGATLSLGDKHTTIRNPNNIFWDQYDMVVITGDSKEYFEETANHLTSVYKVPREKIKTCWEVVFFSKEMKEFYKWREGKLDNTDSIELFTKKELSGMLDVDSLNDLEKFFLLEEHRIIHKWLHYFDAYDRFFSKYRGKDITILEIGVFKGGSLQMWKNYFKTSGNKVQIYGIDIDPNCKRLEEENIKIFIGSQEDREFLRKVKEEIGKVDILIDDGGHTMNQQIVTFEEMFDFVADDGLYLCEDMHSSYWEDYGGGYKGETFIEYTKNLIDYINAHHSQTDQLQKNVYTDSIGYVTYCDSMMFIEKKPMAKRYDAMS